MTDLTARIDLMAVQAVNLFVDAVSQIPSASWDAPSNLDGWSLRDLVGHATGSTARIVALAEGAELWDGPSQPTEWTDDEPVRRLHVLAAQLRDALPAADLDAIRPSPQGEVPLRRALCFPVADLAMHSWDVHRSLGRSVDLPPDLLAFCESLVASVPEDILRSPGRFGPARTVPENSSPTARLMGFLGRPVDGSVRG